MNKTCFHTAYMVSSKCLVDKKYPQTLSLSKVNIHGNGQASLSKTANKLISLHIIHILFYLRLFIVLDSCSVSLWMTLKNLSDRIFDVKSSVISWLAVFNWLSLSVDDLSILKTTIRFVGRFVGSCASCVVLLWNPLQCMRGSSALIKEQLID